MLCACRNFCHFDSIGVSISGLSLYAEEEEEAEPIDAFRSGDFRDWVDEDEEESVPEEEDAERTFVKDFLSVCGEETGPDWALCGDSETRGSISEATLLDFLSGILFGGFSFALVTSSS